MYDRQLVSIVYRKFEPYRKLFVRTMQVLKSKAVVAADIVQEIGSLIGENRSWEEMPELDLYDFNYF